MRTKLLFAVAAALVAGCQSTAYQGNENSPFYVVPPGSRLSLTQPVVIPPDRASIYIQNGQVMPNTEVQHYAPFCKLELYSLSPNARTVQPSELQITKTVQEETHGAYTSNEPLRYAQLGRFSVAQIGGDGGAPPLQSFSTRMQLRSEKQPDVFRMTCAQWGYPGQDRHVTISEIRRTLDPLLTLTLPNESR